MKGYCESDSLFLFQTSTSIAISANRQRWRTNNYQLTMTRGLRNNNPGNIIITNIPWLGKKVQNTDGHFEQFISLRYGCRALLLNLESAIRIHQLNTIDKIIAAYAPNNENNTEDYCKSVCAITGISSTEPIHATDIDKICSIAHAICIVENSSTEALSAGLTKEYFLGIFAKI